ncbi:unnamed protein product [Rhizophagus irregularis]|nr:unnamed protein product [Rhizophagus irregularis]
MKQQLTRLGIHYVVLKRLENVGSADQRWFEEAKSHFTISNKYPDIVNCYEEQEAFHSKSYDDFYIPDNINDFVKSSSSKNNINSQKFSKMFKKLQVKNDSQEDYNNKKTMKHHSCIDDEDEVHNNPNLHSEEQNELEIPDDI